MADAVTDKVIHNVAVTSIGDEVIQLRHTRDQRRHREGDQPDGPASRCVSGKVIAIGSA